MLNIPKLQEHDCTILQGLALQIARIANDPINGERAVLWRQLNDLKSVRPLVFINEIPWHEMNVDNELTIQTSHPWAQEMETWFRRTIYQWRHMPADMIVDKYISSGLVVHDTGFGICEDVDVVKTDENNDVVSRHFNRQIVEPEDIDKIKMPMITHDTDATNERYHCMGELFGNIMPVHKAGFKHIWFTPWDNIIRWWGVQEAMMDLVMRPEMVNAIVSRFVDACLCQLEQYERLNLLSLNNDNTRIGSGGYGYTNLLPSHQFDARHINPADMWGCSNAQIFAGVSPEMHWEFALRHEMRWLEKWGATYYGCCEPLDIKMEILHKIPNLRKISMSPWVNIERAVKQVGESYVFSYKPNPAIFAESSWNPQQIRSDLRAFLDKSTGCHIEIVMKDISTVQYQPQRLWDWEKIVMEEVSKYAA
ncbi:MAG: hypothetical protein A2Y12_03725 [Planctomycetes bacterium GWF2_42_9]|nr:MAG: hypothetical protein A2Y12_03725 [Planctomycetes bacterium GWF2_42_9]